MLENIKHRLIDDHTLEVDLSKKQSLNQVFQQLSDQEINVLSMRNKSNRLEALFMNLIANKKSKKSAAVEA